MRERRADKHLVVLASPFSFSLGSRLFLWSAGRFKFSARVRLFPDDDDIWACGTNRRIISRFQGILGVVDVTCV